MSEERSKGRVPVDRQVRPDDAAELMALIDAKDKWRAQAIPDERTAIMLMFEAWQRLQELGWRRAEYAPTDGRSLELLEIGSTGIHSGRCETYSPLFPVKTFWVFDGDVYPSSPILYREPKSRV